MNSDYKQGLLQNWINLSIVACKELIKESKNATIILPYGLIRVNAHKQKVPKFSSKSQNLHGRNYKYKIVGITIFWRVKSVCSHAKTENGKQKYS